MLFVAVSTKWICGSFDDENNTGEGTECFFGMI